MAGPKIIPGNPYTFDVTQQNANPGDIVLDPTGTVPGISFIGRNAGSARANNELVPVGGLIAGAQVGTFTWTAAGAGSGDGTIDGEVIDPSGTPIVNALVQVGLLGAGAIAGVTGSQIRSRVIGGNDASVVVQTDASGLFTLAFNGATGTALTAYAWVQGSRLTITFSITTP